MPSQRCTAQTKRGGHCRQRTAKGQYCWNHLRSIEGLRLRKSAIPGAGLGLHAARALPKGKHLLYSGDSVELRSDQDGGPYYLQVANSRAIDAARANTAEGRWVNDPRGSGHRANCRFVVHQGRACVEAMREIQKDEELLVSYGAGYWRYHHAGDRAAPCQARTHGGARTSQGVARRRVSRLPEHTPRPRCKRLVRRERS